MAPEQVYGLASEPRTDLYALGCVGYWLLAGRKPFEAESAGELMRLHAQAEPPRLIGVPPRLEALVMTCLAKQVENRPADADRLGADLDHCLDDEPWTEAEAQAWWQLNLGTP